MFLQIIQNLLLLLYLPSVVLYLFVRHLYLKLVIVQLLLLPFYLHAKLKVFPLQTLFLFLHLLVYGLLNFRRLLQNTVSIHAGR